MVAARGALGAGLLALLLGCTNGEGGGGSAPGGPAWSPPPALTFEPGDTVAVLRLPWTPAPTEFVVRGTFPVPADVFPRADGQEPFLVRDAAGTDWPAQAEVVAWRADAARGASVVEVLARIPRAGVSPGAASEVAVIYQPHGAAPLAVDPSIANLVATPGALELEARDVFGHLYTADLLADLRTGGPDLRVLRDGESAFQVRTHELLLPVHPETGPSGSLPHLFGVHAYVTQWAGEHFLSLDLRIHNGMANVDPTDPLDDPMDKLYFDELVLKIPAGFDAAVAFDDPFLDPSGPAGDHRELPLVKPLPGGKLHVMGQMGQMIRRIVVFEIGYGAEAHAELERKTLGFCRDGTAPQGHRLASWWNPQTPGYLTHGLALPDLGQLDVATLRNDLEGLYDQLENTLATGAASPWPILHGVMGWCHPWGPSIGYMHGGSEIEFHPGVDVAYLGSRKGYRAFEINHRMYVCRHPTALFRSNGDPTRLEEWLANGPNGTWNPTWMWIAPVLWLADPFGFTSAPTFQSAEVSATGKQPDYEADLLAYEHIEAQHLGRFTRAPKVLAWLGNDALAKDDLCAQAELVRMSYSDYPNDPNGVDAIVTGMFVDRRFVTQQPHQGVPIHRGNGWEIDTVVAAYAVSDPAWRAALRPWFDPLLDMIETGQDSCTGVVGVNPDLDHLGAQYRTRQSISESILENAYWGMRQSVYASVDQARRERLDAVLQRALYARIGPLVWDPAVSQEHFYTAIGPYDPSLPGFCTFVPPDGYEGHDNYQGWSSLAYGWLLTGDGAFLNHAAAMAHGNIHDVPNFGEGYLQNASPLLWLAQELGL